MRENLLWCFSPPSDTLQTLCVSISNTDKAVAVEYLFIFHQQAKRPLNVPPPRPVQTTRLEQPHLTNIFACASAAGIHQRPR